MPGTTTAVVFTTIITDELALKVLQLRVTGCNRWSVGDTSELDARIWHWRNRRFVSRHRSPNGSTSEVHEHPNGEIMLNNALQYDGNDRPSHLLSVVVEAR